MKRISLFVIVLLFALVAFVGCHKESVDYGNVGVVNLSLQRGYKTANKGAVESFDARVTIYYSTEDTISYNCRFIDTDGDDHYTNDPSAFERIYVRRDAGFWVGVWTVIQGDTVSGMTDPANLLYLSEENPLLDINIVLVAGYPRIVVRTNTEIVGEDILIFGEVLEGGDMLEEYGFAIRPGQLSEDEKRLWASRVLTERGMNNLSSYGNYQFYDAEMLETGTNRFVCALEMMDFDTEEYSVFAIAWLREGVDSLMAFVHSPVVMMRLSDGSGPVEPISTDPTFEWMRNSGDPATGLDEFGLSWQINTKDVFAQITPVDNARLYILESSDYAITDINTLEARLASETEATVYNNVSVTTNNTYDDVIATVYNGKTYLIHVTNCSVEVTTNTTITITGTYKVWAPYSEPTGYKDGYGYVDLGLPSGLMWAYANVGASTPEDYGNYYAWGETETKDTYDWTTYQYCNGSETTLTKYCSDESYGQDGFTDSYTTLEASDDAATANWGTNWRMPTQDEMQELIDNCDTTWTAIDGINGLLFTSRVNGRSIFLTAAGNYDITSLNNLTTSGNYWSSSLRTDTPNYAWYLYFSSVDGTCGVFDFSRFYGHSVRPVCVQSKKK